MYSFLSVWLMKRYKDKWRMVIVYQEIYLSMRKDSETTATTEWISVNRIYFITFPLNVV